MYKVIGISENTMKDFETYETKEQALDFIYEHSYMLQEADGTVYLLAMDEV